MDQFGRTQPLDAAATSPGSSPDSPGDARALEPGARIGRYTVLYQLGVGGMGVVHAAYDPQLDRRVAIKLIRPGLEKSTDASEGRARLVREAQAMAQLAHPNVITVHDVGTRGDEVFVAMAFIDGGTLKQWLTTTKPHWRETLAVLVQAGRGLAAAHAAGLVHRDFKPDNILVDQDGRVCVTDFGLARLANDQRGRLPMVEPLPDPPTEEEEPPLGGSYPDGINSNSNSNITRTGIVMGTPAYMAPEQLSGNRGDMLTDQFALCVTLYEALYGQRPFAGKTFWELARAVTEGEIAEAPTDSRVPGWLRRILVKGLAADPEQRFASVDDLLDALTHDPAVRRRRVLAGIGVVAAIAAAVFALFHLEGRSQRLCAGGREALGDAWDSGRQQSVATAFAATSVPYAAGLLERVTAGLDTYAGEWAAAHRSACEATRVTRVQSEELLELRMACLQRRRQELSAMTSLFADADKEMIATAVQSVQQLVPAATCADIEALTARVPLPRDADTRRAVEVARRDLAAATALERAGRYVDGLAVADRVWAAVAELDYRPVRAETLQLRGELQRHSGSPEAAEQTLYAALWAAESGRADEVVVRAWSELLYVVGFDQKRYDEAERLHRHAAASLERIGGNALLETRLLEIDATVAYAGGNDERADEQWRHALAIAHRSLRADDTRIADLLNNLGVVARRRGELERAFEYYEQALAIRKAALGPEHPRVVQSLNEIRVVREELGTLNGKSRNDSDH